jgi:hypothetical protein
MNDISTPAASNLAASSPGASPLAATGISADNVHDPLLRPEALEDGLAVVSIAKR